MNRYDQYTLDDLVNDDAFVAWVKNPTEQRTQHWEQAQLESPSLRPLIEPAQTIVLQLSQFHPQASEVEVTRIWKALSEQVYRQPATRVVPLHTQGRQRWYWAAAAAVLMVASFGWWQIRQQPRLAPNVAALQATFDAEKPDGQLVQNPARQPRRLTLPDGSTVTLDPNSSLHVSGAFGATRAVYLTGSAFFDIVKDPARPFLVHTPGLTTKVLGTSFRVQARPNDPRVTVQVRSGRVAIYPRSLATTRQTPSLILTPNQQAVYNVTDERLVRSLVALPQVVLPTPQLPSFVFEEAPVAVILDALEQTYGVDIVYETEAFKACTLTTTFTNETLFQRLDILCKLTGATYQVVDAQLVISGGANCRD